jgi:3',5'-cyclic AMP phosphodiesterase CpdA
MSHLRFAHFSDPHLPLEPDKPRGWQWLSKRCLSYASWRRKRRAIHDPAITQALVSDVKRAMPEHIVVTGDIANLALPGEFQRGAAWLAGLGAGAAVSYVPGNHDALAFLPHEQGLGLWDAHMRDDDGRVMFPYCRIRGPVAFIGLNSGVPSPLGLATGRLGAAQIAGLETLLSALGQRGLCRIILLHHPVAAGAVPWRKRLADAPTLRAVLARTGAELLLHGHAHRGIYAALAGPGGLIPTLTMPSASARRHGRYPQARWQMIAVEDQGTSGWRIEACVRTLTGDPALGQRPDFAAFARYVFLLPKAAEIKVRSA